MTKRKTISKRLRFQIFKRDSFTCQYCSAKPPAVPLEIDHIIPVSKGGNNEEHNLITACFDCNRGKSNEELTSVPSKIAERIERVTLAQDQYKQYKRILKKQKKLIDEDINSIEAIYSSCFEGWIFGSGFRLSVKKFIAKLGIEIVSSAMERACNRIYDKDEVLKYFCGICWNEIREGGYDE